MYENAKYYAPFETVIGIFVNINGNSAMSLVPLDPANTDYAAIMALVAANELTIEEAS
jgi:hypothetical protein